MGAKGGGDGGGGAKTLFLVRHGATGRRWQGRYLGRTDVDLAPEGRESLARLAEHLAAFPVAGCWTSPLRRCRASAAVLAGRLGCPVHEEPDLAEVDFGDWEGLTFAEIQHRDPQGAAAWAAAGADFVFPGGEAVAGFHRRVAAAARRLVAQPGEYFLIVGHGGSLRVLLCHLLGLDPGSAALAFTLAPAGLAVVRHAHGHGVLCELRNQSFQREKHEK